MFYFILPIFVFIVVLVAYFSVIKPYRTIQEIKRKFQSKGYRVLIEKLDWNDDTMTSAMLSDTANHKDGLHRYKTTWQDYDVAIKNSYSLVYVSLNSIKLVKEAYKQIESLEKPWMMKSNYGRFYGGGLLMSDGPKWKSKRKLYAQIFNFSLLEQLHPSIEKSVQSSMNKWKVGEKIDLMHQFRTMYFDTFVHCYFGRTFDEFSYQDETFSQALSIAFEQMIVQTFSLRHMLFGTKFLEKGYFKEDQDIQRRVRAIKEQTKQFVLKRYEQILSQKDQSEKSILSALVFTEELKSLSNEDKQKAMEEITGDVLMFFFAGTDSNSAVLAATVHMLNQHPEVREKLIQQLKQSEEGYSHSIIKKWKYMDAVMNEVLRLYGPFNWIFVRQILTDDFKIDEINLPKQTIIGIQTHTIHCSQKYYKKPFEFIPQRFLYERNQDPYTFVSFGAGQRNCIGQYLARIQYKIALAKFLRKFSFETDEEFVMHIPSIYQSKNNKFTLHKLEK